MAYEAKETDWLPFSGNKTLKFSENYTRVFEET
jgi:hypothetical protein